jgi:nitroreductase/FMN reductase [NAD(P)H]
MDQADKAIRETLAHRFGETLREIPARSGPDPCPQSWTQLASRGSCRRFADKAVAPELVDMLCALALSAPTKSDLQQRDIVIIEDKAIRSRIDTLLSTGPLAQDWIPSAPALLVFCGNNRRQRQLHEWRGKAFVNDHLDAFFNAAVDAGIALAAFVMAAEAAGLGCACISAIRNHAREVSELLRLPDHVFPVAGLGLGWPARETYVSLRLPLSVTVHRNRFTEAGIKDAVDAYDRRRAGVQPIRAQRAVARFGTADFYGWSEDKVRQYATPERADWGAFVRGKGFRLE